MQLKNGHGRSCWGRQHYRHRALSTYAHYFPFFSLSPYNFRWGRAHSRYFNYPHQLNTHFYSCSLIGALVRPVSPGCLHSGCTGIGAHSYLFINFRKFASEPFFSLSCNHRDRKHERTVRCIRHRKRNPISLSIVRMRLICVVIVSAKESRAFCRRSSNMRWAHSFTGVASRFIWVLHLNTRIIGITWYFLILLYTMTTRGAHTHSHIHCKTARWLMAIPLTLGRLQSRQIQKTKLARLRIFLLFYASVCVCRDAST